MIHINKQDNYTRSEVFNLLIDISNECSVKCGEITGRLSSGEPVEHPMEELGRARGFFDVGHIITELAKKIL